MEVEEAKKLLEEEKQKRVQECAKELAEILKKYDCDLRSYVNLAAKE